MSAQLRDEDIVDTVSWSSSNPTGEINRKGKEMKASLEDKAAKTTGTVAIHAGTLLELLEGVITHAGKDKSLPLLNTISIVSEGDQVIAKATDRYRLIEGKVEQVETMAGSLPATVIPVDDAKKIIALAKAAKSINIFMTIERDGDRVTARYLDQEVSFRAFDGTYPPTDQLWPAEDQPRVALANITLNPSFFADYAKIVGKKGSVTIEFIDEKKPIIIGLEGNKVTWRALLMPMRKA